MTADHRRQLAAIELALSNEDPALARDLSTMRRRVPVMRGAALLVPLMINLVGLVTLVGGAVTGQVAVFLTGLFVGMLGPLLTVMVTRLLAHCRGVQDRAG